MNTSTAATTFVSIGQGRAIHIAHVFTYGDGDTRLAAKCDQAGFATVRPGRRVRPVQAAAATCKACLRIAGED